MVRHLALAASEPGYLAVLLLRIQAALVADGHVRSAALVRHLAVAWTGADFVTGCQIGEGVRIMHPVGIVIGGGAVLGSGCTILQQVTVGERYGDGRGRHDYPVIGNGVVLGAGAQVLGGIYIGDGAVIGAGAVVLSDVPAGCTAVGTPARALG